MPSFGAVSELAVSETDPDLIHYVNDEFTIPYSLNPVINSELVSLLYWGVNLDFIGSMYWEATNSFIGLIPWGITSTLGVPYSLNVVINDQYSGKYSILDYNSVNSIFNSSYVLDLFSIFHSEYSLNLVINKQIGSVYSIKNTNPVESFFTGLYSFGLGNELFSTYSLNELIGSSFTSEYSITNINPVTAAFISEYSFTVDSVFYSGYSLNELVTSQSVFVYSIVDTNTVINSFVSPYSSYIESFLQGEYSLNTVVTEVLSSGYDLTSTTNKAFVGLFSIDDHNPVKDSFRGIYTLISTVLTNITELPYLTHNGRKIHITSADISIEEGDAFWRGTFVLADVYDYSRFQKDEDIDFTLGGDVYSFIIDAKNLNRSNPASIVAVLESVSPSARLDFPRVEPFTKTWEDSVYAKVIVEELLGYSIQWDLVDWLIPGYRFGIEKSSPVASAALIVEAAGGRLEAGIDGTLYVRHRYPVSIPNYSSATIDHSFYEEGDIFLVQEEFVTTKVINQIRILDIAIDFKDFVEWAPNEDNPFTGELRAFPGPWRSEVAISTTSSNVSLSSFGTVVSEVYEDEDGLGELVEIFNGEGSVRYPIWSIADLQWESGSFGLSFETGNTIIKSTDPNNLYGLVRIRYGIKYYKYTVAAFNGDPAQFLMLDTTGD